MKAVVTVKVKGGYLSFPWDGPVTLQNVESSEIVSSKGYSYKDDVGKAVVELLDREVESNV
jgi:hypothetical protein